MICSRCQDMPGELFGDIEFNHNHSPSYNSLRASAERGCPSCMLIKQSLDFDLFNAASGPFDTDDAAPVTLSRYVDISKGLPLAAKAGRRHGSIKAWSDQGLSFGEAFGLAETPDNPATFHAVRQCIADCLESHPGCPKPDPSGALPTRLLDVGLEDGSIAPRLCPGDACRQFRGRYLTLSYCWGSAVPLRTIRSNIRQMEAGIAWDSMPRTFQDAIRITRGLGVRHIWIDALCIVQDDEEDWEREAATMGRVYARSLCTVAAITSDSCQGGVLYPRNAIEVSPAAVQLSRSDGQQVAVSLYPNLPPWSWLHRDSPLTKRGWTLQESELSPRMLFFNRYETVWQCLSTEWTENMHRDSTKSGIESKKPEKQWLIGDDGGSSQQSRNRAYRAWESMVRNFSARSFTFITDRLVAISGMARLMQARTADTYAAGLWQDDLLHGLLWNVEAGPRRRTAQYVAPSWSWLSIEGRVGYEGDIYTRLRATSESCERRYRPDVVAVEVQLKGQDTFGQLVGGFIRLRGWIKQARCGDIRNEKSLAADVYDLNRDKHQESIAAIHFDVDADAHEHDCVYILCVSDWGELGERGANDAQGLGLVRVDDESGETYRRVAYARWINPDWLQGVTPREVTII